MATGIAIPNDITETGGLLVVISWRRDDGTLDRDQVTVEFTAGQSTAQINSAYRAAVRARAAALGLAVPTNGITFVDLVKG